MVNEVASRGQGDGPPRHPPAVAVASPAGDGEFLRHWSRLERWLRGVARRLVACNGLDAEWADDLVQDAALALLESTRWRELHDAKPYLRGLLHNKVASEVGRAIRRRTESLDALGAHGEPADETDPFDALLSRLEATDRLPQLLVWLERLPDKQRAAIYLTRIRGLTTEQAAHELGVRSGTTKRNVFDGTKKLLRWAKEEGWES